MPTDGTGLPPRLIINGLEGTGKTSLAAAADSGILMARDETGYETLFNAGRVPARPNVRIESWEQLLAQLEALILQPKHTFRWLALDALGGFEQLCFEHVCTNEYGGNNQKFLDYGKGAHASMREWLKLLQSLDRLREKQNMGILILSHVTVKRFDAPGAQSYDRFIAACHQKTWDLTHKWSDAALFFTFNVVLDKDGKASGVGQRVIYTERADAYDAKNRFGMPPIIPIKEDPAQAWETIQSAMSAKGTK